MQCKVSAMYCWGGRGYQGGLPTLHPAHLGPGHQASPEVVVAQRCHGCFVPVEGDAAVAAQQAEDADGAVLVSHSQ